MFNRISFSMIICVWLALCNMLRSGNGIVVEPSALRMAAKSGFAKSRPAAQRPAACGPLGPSGPRRPGGPAARRPSPDFPQFFCPAVNPRSCTDLHRVWACKMNDGEFELIYHFFTILIMISILLLFFCCMDLSELDTRPSLRVH